MGFSSGKSKAKREAKKAEQKALLAALGEAKEIDRLSNNATNQARQLKNANPDVDYNVVRLASKADKLAREANKQIAPVNETVGKYNDRVGLMRRQMNGESITEYQAVAPRSNVSMGGMADYAMASLPSANKSYSTLAEAQSAAAKLTEKAQAEAAKPNGMFNGVGGYGYQGGLAAIAGLNQTRPSAEATVKEVQMGPITTSYRSLSQTQDAYNDISGLSKQVENQVKSSGLESFGTQYSALGDRIRGALKRQQTIKAPGLIESEVLTPGKNLPDIYG